MAMKQAGWNKGFSLVELSIVLVILGLLVGGVLGGRNLIKAAELRAVGEEALLIESAVLVFKETYQQLPGDMVNAEQYWNGTANGNGDGFLEYAPAPGEFGEIFTYWQHMSLAGMLPGAYTGRSGSGSIEDALAGENVMASRFPRGGWSVSTIQGYDPSGNGWYDRKYGLIVQTGAKSTGWEYGAALFTPADAFHIDSKFDDGIPATGKMVGRYWWDTCATATIGTTSSTNFNTRYRVEDPNPRCALAFIPAYD